MKQEPVIEQLLPLSGDAVGSAQTNWDVYEPDAKEVVDDLLIRYVEALIYQAVAENMASEQSARMVAMKSASDNAKNVIGELKLVYNKTRQAAITKELSRSSAAPRRCNRFQSLGIQHESRYHRSVHRRGWTSSSRVKRCPRSMTP